MQDGRGVIDRRVHHPEIRMRIGPRVGENGVRLFGIGCHDDPSRPERGTRILPCRGRPEKPVVAAAPSGAGAGIATLSGDVIASGEIQAARQRTASCPERSGAINSTEEPMKSVNLLGLAVAVALGAAPALAGPTLDKVKAAGAITCGVSTGLAGFSMADQQGNYTGLDVDTCRAIAAAVLGDAKKAKFVPLSAQQRFTALQSGEVDILTRNTTETLAREAD